MLLHIVRDIRDMNTMGSSCSLNRPKKSKVLRSKKGDEVCMFSLPALKVAITKPRIIGVKSEEEIPVLPFIFF